MKAIELKFTGIFATLLPPYAQNLRCVVPSVQPVDGAVWPPEDQCAYLLAELEGLGARD
jgi:hypothetical protein